MTRFAATEPFDSKRHHVVKFNSGQPALDAWLQLYAGQSQRRDAARTFVTTADDGAVLGFYTLVAAQVEHSSATAAVRRGLSKHSRSRLRCSLGSRSTALTRASASVAACSSKRSVALRVPRTSWQSGP